MIKKFERIISNTQSNYRASLEKKEITQQCSYNLPIELESYLLNINALVRETPIGVHTHVKYVLSEEYHLVLGANLYAIIDEKYSEITPRAIFTHTEGDDGKTPKFQLKKTDFNAKGLEFKWFVDLYNHNIEGVNFVVLVNESTKEIKFDIELTRKLFESTRQEIILEDDKDLNIDESSRLTGGENVILYGVPGAGKSWTVENEYVDDNTKKERVVFHPDYTYSDFVGQILPKSIDGNVTYDFIPGPFTKIVKEAIYNPTKKFILVIEEINRGNAPAIFGDIFQLLDRKQTGRSAYEIKNSDIAKSIFGTDHENDDVYIPSNLWIICTMNTSDQNVFTLDTAFQRRWNMRLIENTFKKDTKEEKEFAEHKILDTDVSWEAFCDTINKLILEKNQNMTSSEDKRLGTHFVSIEDLTYIDENINTIVASDDDLKKQKEAKLKNRRFPEKVIKYLWDDAFKFYRADIFKGEFDSLEKIIKEFTQKTKNDRFNVFKDAIKGDLIDAGKKSQG